MRLHVIRHAIATPKEQGIPDAQRPLTSEGRKRFRGVVAGLREMGVRYDRLYHSPKLRAVETAEPLAPLVRGETVVTSNLATPPAKPLLDELHGDRVAVVGHEPHLGSLVAWLVTGSRTRGGQFELKKGGVTVLEGEPRPGGMRIVAMYPPRSLRRMARS